jgi:serine/threonine protein kinase
LAATTRKPAKTTKPETFKVSEVIASINVPMNLKKMAPNAAKELITQAEKYIDFLTKTMVQQEPKGDELFDLALKTPEQLQAELARSLGIDTSSSKCGEDEKALVRDMAKAMLAKMLANYPNKASAKQTSIKDDSGKDLGFTAPEQFGLDGATFGKPKYLTSGGMAHIVRYEKQNKPGEFVILKLLKDAKAREEMVHEMRMHRQAAGEGHPNVIGFDGLVLDPNGAPYMVMEDAAGGNVENLGLAVGGAAAAGVLPEEARQVFAQHMLRQAVEGLAYIQASNLIHRDIKPKNYLLGGDGTVKIADFGSAHVGDAKGETPGTPVGTTPEFLSPELSRKVPVSGKVDTYSLGCMMAAFASPNQGMSEILRKGRDAFVSPNAVTAFDRLRNAMLDQNPDNRPTLEAVQQSIYLTDAEKSYDPKKVEALVAATMAYTKNMPEEGREAQEKLLEIRGKIANQQRYLKQLTDSADIEKTKGEIAKMRAQEKQYDFDLHTVLKSTAMKKYVDGLKGAAAAVEGRGKDDAIDLKTFKFAVAFQELMEKIKSPYVEPEILDELKLVDTAKNPEVKRRLIGRALRALAKHARKLDKHRKALRALPKPPSQDEARQEAEQDYEDRRKELQEELEMHKTTRDELKPVLDDLNAALKQETAAAESGQATGVDYRDFAVALTAVMDTLFANQPDYNLCLQQLLSIGPAVSTADKVQALSNATQIVKAALPALEQEVVQIRTEIQSMWTKGAKEAVIQAAQEKARAGPELALKESEVASTYRALERKLQVALDQLSNS